MLLTIPSNKIPFVLTITVSCKQPTTLSAEAFDANKPSTVYLSRQGRVETKNPKTGQYTETYTLRFPISPDTLLLEILGDCTIDKITSDDLKTCPQWMDKNLAEFLPFAEWFSTNAGIFSATVKGQPSVYRSSKGNMRIEYYDVLTNDQGNAVTTPARVGHTTGKIEVSKLHFSTYTVPIRLLVLLHEYCHKYVNPLVGRRIDDEVSADLQALNIFLNAGHSPVEARYCYLAIFNDANSDINTERFAMIDRFITDFENGKLGCTTSYGRAS